MDMARSIAPMARDIAREFGRPIDVPMPALAPMAPLPPMTMRWNSDERIARPFFQQGEPEDSVYRLAHDLLSRGDYGRAAQMFKDIAQKYPKSVYTTDLPYYEAWARYKIGTTEELRTAVKLLEPRVSKFQGVVLASSGSNNNMYYQQRRGTNDGDVAGLYARINSALASRGDRDAADRVAKLAQAGANTCDNEEIQVKIEAMSALTSMDPTRALPVLRSVLEKKDECTAQLRQRAVFILGSKRGDAEAASLIATAAKSDPSRSVRTEAINWLPKLQGDAGVAALEDLLRTESDKNIQRSIVRTLTSSDNPKARSSMRALIDRKDAPIGLRIEAINSYASDRATSEDAAYLRNLYGKADNDGMKDAIISTVSRMGGQDNDQWVLAIARNPNESSRARGTAISRAMRSNTAITDVVKLYDSADNLNIRQQIVSVLGSRKEPEATDKLIEIVKTGTVMTLRTQAIGALQRKNDPRATQLLVDILDGKSEQTIMRISHSLPPPRFSAAAGADAEPRRNRVLRSRIVSSSAPDGRVQFTFAARSGTCGNGRSYIQTAPNSITGSFSYNGNFYGNYNDGVRMDPCVAEGRCVWSSIAPTSSRCRFRHTLVRPTPRSVA